MYNVIYIIFLIWTKNVSYGQSISKRAVQSQGSLYVFQCLNLQSVSKYHNSSKNMRDNYCKIVFSLVKVKFVEFQSRESIQFYFSQYKSLQYILKYFLSNKMKYAKPFMNFD